METNSVADSRRAERGGIVVDTTDHAESVTRNWHADGSFLVPLLEAVEELTEQPIEQLAPLHSAIEPEAAERLLSTQTGENRVSFSYEGCHVTVWNTGQLVVCRA